MGYEIERKFLLLNDSWQSAVTETDTLRDGLLLRANGGKVRVRQGSNRAWITVKGARVGIGRPEFEYEIPVADAADMIRTLCIGPPLEKMRHTVHHAGLVWSIDVHLGALAGVEFAEVELSHANEHVDLPGWVGEEITNDVRFRKEALLQRCLEATGRQHS